MRGWLAAFLAALAGLCSAAVALAPPAGDVARGAAVYAKNSCQGCHGIGAVGGTSPPLVGPEWKYGGDPASIAKSIRDGHMPLMLPMGGEKLSEADIADITAYLKDREKNISAQERAVATANTATGAPKGIVHSAVQDFRVETVAKTGTPYAFDFLPDGRILIMEIQGNLRVVDHGKLLAKPIESTPKGDITGMTTYFRRGNLSLAVHPNYNANGWIYILTARVAPNPPKDGSPYIGTIHRGRITGGRWVDDKAILELPIEATESLRMKFDKRGYLYIGTPYSNFEYSGEDKYYAGQDVARPEGKILRIQDDGSVPPDNPFVGKPGAYPYVWSYGHREPSGLTFDGQGELWNVEDGQRGGDELNHVRKGHNYGWPVITWGHPYFYALVPAHTERAGMEQPVVSWVPSPALSDVEWYGGNAFPRWKGSFFIGSMKQRDMFRVPVDGDRGTLVETVLHNVDRLRDIGTGPDGMIYVLTDSGDLLRLVPAH